MTFNGFERKNEWIMKKIISKLIYAGIGLMMLLPYSCSGDLLEPTRAEVSDAQGDASTRADLVTCTIDSLKAGTLWHRMKELLGEETASTVQKLIITGEFSRTDGDSLRTYVSGIQYLDLSGVTQFRKLTSSTTDSETGVTVNTFEDTDEIENQMISYMPNMVEITLPEDVIKLIHRDAFRNSPKLERMTIPASVEYVDIDIFYDCTGLKEAIFNCPITILRHGIFFNCQSLEEFVMPSTVETVENEVFEYCYSLKKVICSDKITNIQFWAFHGCRSLEELTIPQSVTSVSGSMFDGCSGLKKLYWKSLTSVPSCPNDGCFLFLTSQDGEVAEYDSSWKNVYIDGVPSDLNLVLNAKSSNFYYIPATYTAEKVRYTAEFNTSGHYTGGGVSANWQTIVLPFKPTKITSAEKGELAPFNSGVEGAKPFWLRELTSEGFVDVTEIEPNKPYIIAMPYNPDFYIDDYNIQGKVVFEADSVVLQATDSIELKPCVGPDFTLYPTYSYVKKAGNIYALNTDGTFSDVTQPGSAFVRSYQAVYPFEAYVMGTTSMRGTISLSGTRAAVRGATAMTRGLTNGKRGIPQIDDM
jgi:hypothetical protein